MDKKNRERNFLSITQFLAKAFFMGIGISNILEKAKESTIFVIILGTLFGCYLLTLINKFNYKEVKGIRKWSMFILVYILLIIGLEELINLISSIYLIDTNKFFITIPLLLVILYLNTKDISVNFKVSSILVIVCNSIYFLAVLGLIPDIKTINFFPLFNVPFTKVLLISFEFAIYSITPCILFGGIKNNIKNLNKKIIKEYIGSNLVLTSIFLLTQGVLGIELVNLFKYPEYVILKKINLLDFINNVENILSFCWLFMIFMYLSICSKQLYDISYSTFNKKWIYPIFLIVSMYFISSNLYDDVNFLIFMYDYLWIICIFIVIIYMLINIPSLKKK